MTVRRFHDLSRLRDVMRAAPRTMLAALAIVWALASHAPAAQPDASAIPPGAERIYRAVAPEFNPRPALETAVFMDQFWRVAGNVGFYASQDRIRDQLLASGFIDRRAGQSEVARARAGALDAAIDASVW